MIAPLRINKREILRLPPISNDYSSIFDGNKQIINDSLQNYVLGIDGTLNGDQIQNTWFPTNERFDFFISHAHGDEQYAKRLASWFYSSFGFTCFIDSQIWGSADKLQLKIDKTIRGRTQKEITYKQTQDSSAHVHAMLSMALMDVIDKSNFFIFIQSNQSLRPFEPNVTNSPWLYEEVSIANHISRKVTKTVCFSTQTINEERQNIVHAVRIKQYPVLTMKRLIELFCLSDSVEAYDYLLNLKPTSTFRRE